MNFDYSVQVTLFLKEKSLPEFCVSIYIEIAAAD